MKGDEIMLKKMRELAVYRDSGRKAFDAEGKPLPDEDPIAYETLLGSLVHAVCWVAYQQCRGEVGPHLLEPLNPCPPARRYLFALPEDRFSRCQHCGERQPPTKEG
jgi:hypothetical protein